MEPMQDGGVSIWLRPQGEVGRELAGWIDRLAERFRTERFEPHLTLLANAGVADDAVLAAARAAASELRPFTVRLEGIEGLEEHFRCLFVPASQDAALGAAHAAVARALGREPDPRFLPHLSLVYGRLLPEQKAAVAHEAGADVSLRFHAAALHVWATRGGVRDWRELGAFPFGTP